MSATYQQLPSTAWNYLAGLYAKAVASQPTFGQLESHFRRIGIRRSRFQIVQDLETLYMSTGQIAYLRCIS